MNILKELIFLLHVDKNNYKRDCDIYSAYLVRFFWSSVILGVLYLSFSIFDNIINQVLEEGLFLENLKILFTQSDFSLLSDKAGQFLFLSSFAMGIIAFPKMLQLYYLDIKYMDVIFSYERKKDFKRNLQFVLVSFLMIVVYSVVLFYKYILFLKVFLFPMGVFGALIFLFSFLNLANPYITYKYLKLKRKHCKLIK